MIGKMSAEEVEMVNGTAVLRSLPGRRDQTSIETATIETSGIGKGTIDSGRIVTDPIASGNPALPGRRYRAIETATIERGEIGNAPTAGIPIVLARTPRDRQSRAIETATSGIEKTGSAQIVARQIEPDAPAPHGQKHGRMIEVSSALNEERAAKIAMKAKELP